MSVGKPVSAHARERIAGVVAAVTDYEPQLIVHAASSPGADEESHLLSGLATVGIRTTIIGSAAVLAGSRPDVEDRHSENAPTRPISRYGEFKLWQETKALELRAKGWAVAVARLFNPIGPGMRAHLMLGRLVREIVRRERMQDVAPQIEIGSLSAVRDFIHVDDAADAVLEASLISETPSVIHIACGEGLPVRHIARTAVAMSTRKDLELCETLTAPSESATVARMVGDAALLLRLTGWKPTRSVESAVWDALSAERARTTKQG
jgi:nucleoside-diphosphate-sugar epimerase